MRVIFKCLWDFMSEDDFYSIWLPLKLQISTATTSLTTHTFLLPIFFPDVILTSFKNNLRCQGVLPLRLSLDHTTEQCKIYHVYFYILVQLICQFFLVMHFWFVIQEALHWYIFFLSSYFAELLFLILSQLLFWKTKQLCFGVFWREETIIAELH